MMLLSLSMQPYGSLGVHKMHCSSTTHRKAVYIQHARMSSCKKLTTGKLYVSSNDERKTLYVFYMCLSI